MFGVGRWMFDVLLFLILLFTVLPAHGNGLIERPTVIVAVGVAGEAEFGQEFSKWAEDWQNASGTAGANFVAIGLTPTNIATDLALLKQALASEPTNSATELWLVLIGHGTFDGKEAKFNLRGPDLSATELAACLQSFQRPVVVINCASASSPFLNKLSRPNRVVITATRSGYEQNFARFGKFIAEAINDPVADLDKDGQTSVLEAFIIAARRTTEFYESEGRLATEHALLDDNGDGLGTPADFFRGIRAVKAPASNAEVDGTRAHQIHLVVNAANQNLSPELRAQRNELELAIFRLRQTKISLAEDEYYRRLEVLLRELAMTYEPAK
jgi:hypothetical protein